MIESLRRTAARTGLWKWLVAVTALGGALYLGLHPSRRWLLLLGGAGVGVLLLTRPVLGLFAVVLAALALPMQFSTGTQVSLNPATLLVPALIVAWLSRMLLSRRLRVAPSPLNAPLLVFLAAGIVSLLLGNVLWDPAVPRIEPSVQLAQWAIFAFSSGALWLAGNLIEERVWLRRLTLTFLAVGGALGIVRILPVISGLAGRFGTVALIRAPFWMLMAALAGGQLLFNPRLSSRLRVFLAVSLLAVFAYAFVLQRQSVSNWVGVGTVVAVLVWLRWPRFRWPAVLLLAALAAAGFLQSVVWEFAGGESEWILSGGSRLTLIRRVVSVTMRNPIMGLGPASYRPYANLEPLGYREALWLNPKVSSHNNYVDLFAHTGVVGLAIFAWFAVELAQLGLRLHRRFEIGFEAGYVNAMMAAGAASLVLMLFADWILPFVYNVGFPGFQASVLVWLFMGGLVALDNMPEDDPEA